MDRALFYFINGWPNSLAPVFVFFSEATKAPEYKPWVISILLALILLMIWRGEKYRKTAFLTLLAWPLANEFSEMFKISIPMLRPCNELPDAIMRVGKLGTYGTASSHSANMAAIAFVFVYQLGWLGSPWILIAFLTGLSRIYVGVHYPSQVLLGWLCGAVVGLIVCKTWEAFSKRQQGAELEAE